MVHLFRLLDRFYCSGCNGDRARIKATLVMKRFLVFLSHGFGLGLIPKAPGTFGSLLGLGLVWVIQSLCGEWGCILLTAPLFLAGIPVCSAGQKHFAKEDPGQVVFDEIAAFTVVYMLIPLSLATAIPGFLLFRFFDIVKPWPIRRFEKLPGAWGVMADDTVAGAFAGILLWLLSRAFPIMAA